MDISSISTLGAANAQASSLAALLNASSSTASSGLSAAPDADSDSLDLSAEGLSAANAQDSSFLTDLNNLGTLISSGDLTGAQKALAEMQAKMKAHHGSDGDSSGSDPIGSDFTALSTALNSGDTRSAQAAFKTLQTDLANGPGGAQGAGSTGNPSQDAWLLAAYTTSASPSASS